MVGQQFDPYSQNGLLNQQNKQGVYLKDRLIFLKEKFNYFAVRIFPYIGRFITFLFFYIRKIITAGIKIALEQMKF